MEYRDVSANTVEGLLSPRRFPRRLIVLHETIGVRSLGWLQSGSLAKGSPASCDFLISRVGDIFQIGRPGYYTYHTGTARWQLYQDPDYSLNMSGVGIELENLPSAGQAITSSQYIACGALCRELIFKHKLRLTNIVGHYEIALPRGRKSDPQTLNWQMLSQEILLSSPESASLQFPAVLP